MLQLISPPIPYNVSTSWDFLPQSQKTLILSGASDLDLINRKDKGGHLGATNTNSSDNEAADDGQRTEGTRADLFSCV